MLTTLMAGGATLVQATREAVLYGSLWGAAAAVAVSVGYGRRGR